jgi:DNA topoisomerase-2
MKRKIEERYKNLSLYEQVLLRPDTYTGSLEKQPISTWICDREGWNCSKKTIDHIPAFIKCFDEILTNASDHATRKDENSNVTEIRVYTPEPNRIIVKNDGEGIPVMHHKDADMLLPEMIFGLLLSGENYNDDDTRYGAGRNGFGAKLTNMFSSSFKVTTCDGKKKYEGVWKDRMSVLETSKVTKVTNKNERGTIIDFTIDPKLFGVNDNILNEAHIALIKRRLIDVAVYCVERVSKIFKVYFNDELIPISSFNDWLNLFLKEETPRYIEKINENYQIGVSVSDDDLFDVVSIVNGNTCYSGGLNVNYITDQIVKGLQDKLHKKIKDLPIRATDIKGRMTLFVLSAIANPSFSTQTKEFCTTQVNKHDNAPNITEKSLKKIIEQSGILEKIDELIKSKEQKELSKLNFQKYGKPKIEKLDDAIKAGTKESLKCALILTEGDSAKSTAMSGLSVVGRDYFGVYPLRGKVTNVRKAKLSKILSSTDSEIPKIITALGLTPGKKYNTPEALSELRYGSVILFTDQDHDGAHIKGLLVNFFHWLFPELLEAGFVCEFRTPLVKATNKKGEQIEFYSLTEYKEWANKNDTSIYKIKYYKGLGSSTSQEAKQYFKEIEKNLLILSYDSKEEDGIVEKAFSEKCVQDRKEWLSTYAKYNA